jgi:hypothetical protein
LRLFGITLRGLGRVNWWNIGLHAEIVNLCTNLVF